MAFDIDPLVLLASALTALTLAVPLAFALAAGVIAAPRRSWSTAGLAMGVGLLIGVLLAATGIFVLSGDLAGLIAALAMLPGLALVIVAAVLVILRRAGTRLGLALGAIGCVLIGLSEPTQTLPVMFGLGTSILMVLTAVVIEAVALVVFAGVLVAAAARLEALRVGIAAAGIIAALLTGIGTLSLLARSLIGLQLPAVPLMVTLVGTLIALVAGSIAGMVLDSRQGIADPEPADSESADPEPAGPGPAAP
jgi:hypothetical protein